MGTVSDAHSGHPPRALGPGAQSAQKTAQQEPIRAIERPRPDESSGRSQVWEEADLHRMKGASSPRHQPARRETCRARQPAPFAPQDQPWGRLQSPPPLRRDRCSRSPRDARGRDAAARPGLSLGHSCRPGPADAGSMGTRPVVPQAHCDPRFRPCTETGKPKSRQLSGARMQHETRA